MTTRVSPAQFKVAFERQTAKQKVDLANAWDDSFQPYTIFIRETILPAVGAALRLQVYQRDYYGLDCIYYDEKDCQNFPDYTTYARALAVVIEHENNIRGTHVELNKLQMFNAPLKVLITYPENEEQAEKFLDCYSGIVCGADVFSDFSTKRRQLVIFGTKPKRFATWDYYVYKNRRFVALA
ncbi:MAG: hypothetical protein ACREFF_15675 [Candidatus Udaeobacter sp.]